MNHVSSDHRNVKTDTEGRVTAIEGTPLVPQTLSGFLNERQRLTYRAYRESFVRWLYDEGKHPEKGVGYAPRTANRRAYRTAQFEKWVFERREEYTLHYESRLASEYLRERERLGRSEVTLSHDQKALKNLFDYWNRRDGRSTYDPDERYSSDGASYFTGEYLTRKERTQIREASLRYGTIPHYSSVSPEERTEWNRYLSQATGKPMSEVGPADWEKQNDMKIPSLVMVSLDTGLRPCEVERAKVSWVDIHNGLLRIPAEDAAKERGDGRPWESALSDDTTDVLAEWLRQRENYSEYSNTPLLWLTQKNNPYQSQSLSRLLSRLAEEAGIEGVDEPRSSAHQSQSDGVNRSLTWYSIRRGLATGLIDVADLSTAQSQLRHKSVFSTVRYDQVPAERTRGALNRMG